jgi:hypothetical protein
MAGLHFEMRRADFASLAFKWSYGPPSLISDGEKSGRVKDASRKLCEGFRSPVQDGPRPEASFANVTCRHDADGRRVSRVLGRPRDAASGKPGARDGGGGAGGDRCRPRRAPLAAREFIDLTGDRAAPEDTYHLSSFTRSSGFLDFFSSAFIRTASV